MVKEVSEESFIEEILNCEKLVVLDCYSPRCLPCLRQDEILDKLAGEYKKVKFCKFNADSNPDLADKLRVRSVPTLLFFSGKDGGKIEAQVGLKSEGKLKSEIEKVL